MPRSSLFPRLAALALPLMLAVAMGLRAHAAPGDVDLSFDPGSGLDGTIRQIVPQPDGKILIAGAFNTIRGVRRHSLARLNADGSGDASFDAGDHGAASSMALQPDGKLLIVTGEGLKRLHADGQLDDSLVHSSITPNCGPGWCSHGINTVLLQPDGRILIGGFFGTTETTPVRYGIARLHPDGRLDSSFRATSEPPDLKTGLGGGIMALALRADGKIWVGGIFTTINGVPRQNVARLNADGSLDTSFHPAGAIDGIVHSMIAQPDGKLLVAGQFTTANRANRSLARLNGNGSLDTTFAAGPDVFDHVRGMALQPDGRILATGSLNNAGWAGERVTRLETNGSRDPSFQPDTGIPGVSADCLALQADGRVLLGGYILSRDDVRPRGLVRLEANGSPDASFASDNGLFGITDPTVLQTAVQRDGKIVIAGSGVLDRHGVARLDAAGHIDHTFTAGAGMNGNVAALALEADGAILIGGDFTNARADERLALARLYPDGTLDPGFRPQWAEILKVNDCPPELVERFGYACSGSFATSALAVQSDGKILVAGYRVIQVCSPLGDEQFICGVVIRHFVARFHADGALDTGFASSETGSSAPGHAIKALVVQPDGKVLVAGYFSSINGEPHSGIARLHADGSVDPDFNVDAGGQNPAVAAMALQPDGRLVIGGGFESVNDTPRRGVARLLADGSLDPSFDPGTAVQGLVTSLVLQPDGRVLLSGQFTVVKADAATHLHVARLYANGRHDPSFNLERGPDYPAWTLSLQPDGAVLIGGKFTTVDGVLRPRIARLKGGSPPPALSIARANDQVAVSWAETGSPFVLQETSDLTPPAVWTEVAAAQVPSSDRLAVQLPLTGSSRFFRLAPPKSGP